MALFGFCFLFFEIGVKLVLKILKCVLYSFKAASDKNDIFAKIKLKYEAETHNAMFLFITDLILTISFTLVFTLLSYAFYDGIFRLYFLITALLSYFISKKLFGERIGILLEKISLRLLGIFAFSLSILYVPIKAIVRIISFILSPIKESIKIQRSKKLLRKKIREIDVFFWKKY